MCYFCVFIISNLRYYSDRNNICMLLKTKQSLVFIDVMLYLKIHVKNLSPIFHLLRNFIVGVRKLIIGIVTKKFPRMEVKKLTIKGISVKKYAHGIEPLNSVMGSIASINVVTK